MYSTDFLQRYKTNSMEEWFNNYIEAIRHLYAKKKKKTPNPKLHMLYKQQTLSQSSA